MRNEIDILRDVEHVLNAVCGCNRVMCLPCAQRREVAAYLDVADGKAEPLDASIIRLALVEFIAEAEVES